MLMNPLSAGNYAATAKVSLPTAAPQPSFAGTSLKNRRLRTVERRLKDPNEVI
jgi:hypothetical protein